MHKTHKINGFFRESGKFQEFSGDFDNSSQSGSMNDIFGDSTIRGKLHLFEKYYSRGEFVFPYHLFILPMLPMSLIASVALYILALLIPSMNFKSMVFYIGYYTCPVVHGGGLCDCSEIIENRLGLVFMVARALPKKKGSILFYHTPTHNHIPIIKNNRLPSCDSPLGVVKNDFNLTF